MSLHKADKRHVRIFHVQKHFSQATVGVYGSCWLYSLLNRFGSPQFIIYCLLHKYQHLILLKENLCKIRTC